jgi:sulfur relay (sulfurtransferase) DsrC/TusE family protein
VSPGYNRSSINRSSNKRSNKNSCSSSFNKNDKNRNSKENLNNPPINEHILTTFWEKSSLENKVRFCNILFDDICNKDYKNGYERITDEEKKANNVGGMSNMLDNDENFAKCNVKLLECLQGSSSHNIYRRRMLMWHLMKMNEKRGEGGVWEEAFFKNLFLMKHSETLAEELRAAVKNREREKEENEKRRNDDIIEKDRVVSRLKAKLEQMENLWVTERDRARRLDVQNAIDASKIQEMDKKMQEIIQLNKQLERKEKNRIKELKQMRVKLVELEQANKNKHGISPSLRMIVKAVMQSESEDLEK